MSEKTNMIDDDPDEQAILRRHPEIVASLTQCARLLSPSPEAEERILSRLFRTVAPESGQPTSAAGELPSGLSGTSSNFQVSNDADQMRPSPVQATLGNDPEIAPVMAAVPTSVIPPTSASNRRTSFKVRVAAWATVAAILAGVVAVVALKRGDHRPDVVQKDSGNQGGGPPLFSAYAMISHPPVSDTLSPPGIWKNGDKFNAEYGAKDLNARQQMVMFLQINSHEVILLGSAHRIGDNIYGTAKGTAEGTLGLDFEEDLFVVVPIDGSPAGVQAVRNLSAVVYADDLRDIQNAETEEKQKSVIKERLYPWLKDWVGSPDDIQLTFPIDHRQPMKPSIPER